MGSEPSYEHVQFQLICQPLQQLHFGNYCREKDTALEDTGEIIHADTLFSAIISTAAEQLEKDQFDRLLTGFTGGKSSLSSACYGLKKEEKLLRFYPKPVTADFFKVPDGKKIKRIRYVSDGILNQGITPDQWSGTDCVIIQRCFVALKKELEDLGLKEQIWKDLEIFRKETVMKVQVLRDAQAQNDAGPYAQTNLVLADHSAIGLRVFFWFEACIDTSLLPPLQLIMQIIAASGVGGERSTLNSTFEVCYCVQINQHEIVTSPCMALGLTIPKGEDELNGMGRIITRGGRRMASEGNLKTVKMLEEGALFSVPPEGNIVRLSNEKQELTYRYGKAYCIPIHQNFHFPNGTLL